MPGVHLIFASTERPVNGQEIEELCEKCMQRHREITLADRRFLLIYRPAFSVPLSDVTPETMIGVPIGWNPPKSIGGAQCANANSVLVSAQNELKRSRVLIWILVVSREKQHGDPNRRRG